MEVVINGQPLAIKLYTGAVVVMVSEETFQCKCNLTTIHSQVTHLLWRITCQLWDKQKYRYSMVSANPTFL